MLTIERLFFDIESVCERQQEKIEKKKKEKLSVCKTIWKKNVKWYCTELHCDEDFTINPNDMLVYLLVASAVPSSTIIFFLMLYLYDYLALCFRINLQFNLFIVGWKEITLKKEKKEYPHCTLALTLFRLLLFARWLWWPKREWFTWYVVHDVHSIHYTMMYVIFSLSLFFFVFFFFFPLYVCFLFR